MPERESIYPPLVETVIGAGGLAVTAVVAMNPEVRAASEVSPVGLDAVAGAGEKLGLTDQAVFAIVTIYFIMVTGRGIFRLRRKKNQEQTQT